MGVNVKNLVNIPRVVIVVKVYVTAVKNIAIPYWVVMVKSSLNSYRFRNLFVVVCL